MICSRLQEHNCLNLRAMVGWKCSGCLLASILGTTLLENGVKFQGMLKESVGGRCKWNAQFNQSFCRASRSPAVQVTGSANALSRWEGASPLGGV